MDSSNQTNLEEEPKKKSKVKIFILAFLCFIAFAIIALVLAFSACRWWLVDDAKDLQGTWKIEESSKSITINEAEIRMSDNAIFTYDVDASAKSITEHLAEKEGKVHYVFSFDRTELLLIDQDIDFFSSAFLDAGNLIYSIFSGNYSNNSAGFSGNYIAQDPIVRLHRVQG